jgi:hypothetical protein
MDDLVVFAKRRKCRENGSAIALVVETMNRQWLFYRKSCRAIRFLYFLDTLWSESTHKRAKKYFIIIENFK